LDQEHATQRNVEQQVGGDADGEREESGAPGAPVAPGPTFGIASVVNAFRQWSGNQQWRGAGGRTSSATDAQNQKTEGKVTTGSMGGAELLVELLSFLRIIGVSVAISVVLCSIDIILGLVALTTGSIYAVSELFGISIGARTVIRIARSAGLAAWTIAEQQWRYLKQRVRRLLRD
jgi:hypothetical protein